MARANAGVETCTMVVWVLEVLRNRTLVTGVSNGTTVARAARIRGGFELLFDSAVLVAAKVVHLVGVLAIDNLTAVTVAAVT